MKVDFIAKPMLRIGAYRHADGEYHWWLTVVGSVECKNV
jgi:hypothetical protein